MVATEGLESYDATIRQVVKRFWRTANRVDCAGYDRDDATSILRMTAWNLLGQSRSREYICRSLWNRAKDMLRVRNKPLNHSRAEFDFLGVETYPWDRIELRLDLDKMLDQLPPEEVQILCTVAQEGHRGAGRSLGMLHSTVWQKARRAATKAQTFLNDGRQMNTTKIITADNVHTKTDQEIHAAFGCFGRMWNPWEALCNGAKPCAAQLRCMDRLATVTLPQEALERGAYEPNHETGQIFARPERMDLNELAPEFQSDARGLAYALQYATNKLMGLPVIQPNGQLLPSMAGPPAPPELPKVQVEPVKVEESTPDSLDDILEAAADDEDEEEEVKPAKKAKAQKKVKKMPKVEPEVAKVAPKKVKTVIPTPSVVKSTAYAASTEEFLKRLTKCQATYPLAVGTVLTHVEKKTGESTFITVQSGGYEYNGQLYPTIGIAATASGNESTSPKLKNADGTRPEGTRSVPRMALNKWFTSLDAEVQDAKKKASK